MIPDLSDYKWIVPDIVWEIDEYIDLAQAPEVRWAFFFESAGPGPGLLSPNAPSPPKCSHEKAELEQG